MELPPRVEPVPGAVEVAFPWEAAVAAVDALEAAASTLALQLEARATMLPTIGDWTGRFRDEFDVARDRITLAASGIRETLVARAATIVVAAEEVNTLQQQRNAMVEHAAARAGVDRSGAGWW